MCRSTLRTNLRNPIARITELIMTVRVPVNCSTVPAFPHMPDEQEKLITETAVWKTHPTARPRNPMIMMFESRD